MIAFAPNGDVYIGEGHANESPNDAGSDDPVTVEPQLSVDASNPSSGNDSGNRDVLDGRMSP